MGKQLTNTKKSTSKTGYEQALDDVRHGRITEYASVKEMFGNILSD